MEMRDIIIYHVPELTNKHYAWCRARGENGSEGKGERDEMT